MGVIGTDILDNDFAADAHAEFLGLMEEGVSPRRAVRRMVKEACLDGDPYEVCPFWLGLAMAQVESGRLTRGVRKKALHIIDSGMDLAIWESDSPGDVADRRAVLAKLRERITGPQIRPTRMSRPPKDGLDWEAGDVFAYRLRSGKWTALRLVVVDDRHRERSGSFELYDLTLDLPPTKDQILQAAVRLSHDAKAALAASGEELESIKESSIYIQHCLETGNPVDSNMIVMDMMDRNSILGGLRTSLTFRDLSSTEPDRLVRITRSVFTETDGWCPERCYADDLDTVLEREFGLA